MFSVMKNGNASNCRSASSILPKNLAAIAQQTKRKRGARPRFLATLSIFHLEDYPPSADQITATVKLSAEIDVADGRNCRCGAICAAAAAAAGGDGFDLAIIQCAFCIGHCFNSFYAVGTSPVWAFASRHNAAAPS
jgi:hypothetical protein